MQVVSLCPSRFSEQALKAKFSFREAQYVPDNVFSKWLAGHGHSFNLLENLRNQDYYKPSVIDKVLRCLQPITSITRLTGNQYVGTSKSQNLCFLVCGVCVCFIISGLFISRWICSCMWCLKTPSTWEESSNARLLYLKRHNMIARCFLSDFDHRGQWKVCVSYSGDIYSGAANMCWIQIQLDCDHPKSICCCRRCKDYVEWSRAQAAFHMCI